jgi:hypothetical protein
VGPLEAVEGKGIVKPEYPTHFPHCG